MTGSGPVRRDVLKAAGTLGVGFTLPARDAAATEGQARSGGLATPAAPDAGMNRGGESYQFLSPDEAAFVEAFVDHLVPADELSGSGTALGLSVFIDRQLAGAWGKGARLYMQGPWAVGTPSQGYQLPLAPADLYRAAIRAIDAHCRATYGRGFDRLEQAERQEVVLGLSEGRVALGEVPAPTFFEMAYANVMEGLFADPVYGGNRDKAGWRLVGFPGVIATHAEDIDRFRGKPYAVDPVGIADLS